MHHALIRAAPIAPRHISLKVAAMTEPLIEALTERHGLPLLTEDALDAFVAPDRHTLLFLAGDPLRYPESLDVAVILPELVKAFAGRFSAAVADRDSEQALRARFGFTRWPALVMLRGDAYVGAITRVRDWSQYLAELERLLHADPSRPPGVGIPVVAEGGLGDDDSNGRCH
jgi:hydrogenase-1 operon protein HyaE